VSFDDLPAKRKTNARPRILFFTVQALKNDKNPLRVLRVDADTVIAKRETPFLTIALGRYMNGRPLIATKLDGVAD